MTSNSIGSKMNRHGYFNPDFFFIALRFVGRRNIRVNPVSSKVPGAKHIPIVLLLPIVSRRYFDASVLQNIGSVESVSIRRLKNRTLSFVKIVINCCRPATALMTKVATTVHICRWSETKQASSPLTISRCPSHCSVNCPLGEQNNVACIGCRLHDEFAVHVAIQHSFWHLEIRLVRSRDDTKAAIAWIVVFQNNISA